MRADTRWPWMAAGLLAVLRVGLAQSPPDAQPAQPAQVATDAQPAPATRTLVLRANSLIPLRFMESVSSDVNKPGTNFHMQVTDDINIDDAVVIPAGSIAVGEVIHSQPAGAFGKAGELIVSARYILVGERQIKLHSSLGSAGRSELGAAFLVPFVHGKQAVIAADSEVVAKTAHDESFEVPPAMAH